MFCFLPNLKPSRPPCFGVCVCLLVCMLVCVCVLRLEVGVGGGGVGGYYCFLLVAAQSCLFCGTSVGCVMGFVEWCSVSGVKQAQSRALPHAMGTSGLVSLRLHIHAHLTSTYSLKTHNDTDKQTRSRSSYEVRQISRYNFSNTECREMFHERKPTWPNLRKLWLSCLAAASAVYLFFIGLTACLIHSDHNSTQHSFIGDMCGRFWLCTAANILVLFPMRCCPTL